MDRIFESLEAKFRKPTLKKISKKALTEFFVEHREKSWRNAADDVIEKAMKEDGDAIKTALKGQLKQSVAQFWKPTERSDGEA
jgi:hypothetical protein